MSGVDFNKFAQDVQGAHQSITDAKVDADKSKNGHVVLTVTLQVTGGGTRDIHVTINDLHDTGKWIDEMVPVMVKSFAETQEIEHLTVTDQNVTVKTKETQTAHTFKRAELGHELDKVDKEVANTTQSMVKKSGKVDAKAQLKAQELSRQFVLLQTVSGLFDQAIGPPPPPITSMAAVPSKPVTAAPPPAPTREPPTTEEQSVAPNEPTQKDVESFAKLEQPQAGTNQPVQRRSSISAKQFIQPDNQHIASKEAAKAINLGNLDFLGKLNKGQREVLFGNMVRKDLTDAAFKELVHLYPDEMRKLPGAEMEVNLVEIKDFLDRGVALNAHEGKLVESKQLQGTDTIKPNAQAHINKVIEEALDKKDPKLLALVEAILDDWRVDVGTSIIVKYNTLQTALETAEPRVSVDSYNVPKEFEAYRECFLLARSCDTDSQKDEFEIACNTGYKAAMAKGDPEGMNLFLELQDSTVFGLNNWTSEGVTVKLPPLQIDYSVKKARGNLSDEQVVRASNLVQNEVVRLSGTNLFKVKNEARPAANDHEIHEILPGNNYFFDNIGNNLFFKQGDQVFVVALIPLT